MTDQELKQYCGAVTVPDREIMDAARRRQAELAKPPGSLGKLEDYSIRLAGITGQVRPHVEKCRVCWCWRRITASRRRASPPPPLP